MERYNSPCLQCIRVTDPETCDDKRCRQWQHWFLGKWEQTRKRFGGPAQRIKEPSPCESCAVQGTACAGSCRDRRRWEALQ